MKKTLLVLAVIAAGCIAATGAAQAQYGPDTASLTPINTSVFDVAKAQRVEQSKVILLLTKDIYQREIFEVKSTPAPVPPPVTKYAVKETKLVTGPCTPTREQVESWYEVTKNRIEEQIPWKYVTR